LLPPEMRLGRDKFDCKGLIAGVKRRADGKEKRLEKKWTCGMGDKHQGKWGKRSPTSTGASKGKRGEQKALGNSLHQTLIREGEGSGRSGYISTKPKTSDGGGDLLMRPARTRLVRGAYKQSSPGPRTMPKKAGKARRGRQSDSHRQVIRRMRKNGDVWAASVTNLKRWSPLLGNARPTLGPEKEEGRAKTQGSFTPQKG